MKTTLLNWNKLGISKKFNLAFSLLLSLILLIAATAYLSFLSIRNAEEDIRKSTEIGQQVLHMDRGMERARRLVADFFLLHQPLGLQKAHEQYAQPAIRQISQVISQSSDLKKTLFHSNFDTISRINQMDMNLYLASARRFADTSIEAVELLSKRATPTRGVDSQLSLLTKAVTTELQEFHHLEKLFKEASSFTRQYRISRQRFFMQSAFNSLDTFSQAMDQKTAMEPAQKHKIVQLLDSYRSLGNELLTIDREISGKMRDFSLQEQMVTPVSNALVKAAEDEVQQAQQRIDKVYQLATFIILSITLFAILSMTIIAKLLNHTITGNILSLAQSARKFGKGNMDIRASEKSQDELGQLARVFNAMASQVQDLVGSLEQKVARRTAELSESESFYRQLFDHSSSGVAVYQAVDNGRDFIFKDFNRAGEKIEGISRDALLGHRITEIFPGMEQFGLLDVFRQVWQSGEPALHPVSFYKDATLQGWRENRVYRLPSGEVVSVYDDLTKEKQLEEEKQAVEIRLLRAQKMEAIGLMAGGVAHDLNNILTGITGYPELLLLQLPADSELRKPIESIKESGERAAAVVADLLTVARGVASTRVSANMNTLLTEYLDSPEWHHLNALHPHVQYHKIPDKDLPNISCSPIHIKKCIMNLATNACEAIDSSGSITFSTTTVIPSPQWARENGLQQIAYVVLTVIDTGAGIPQKNIDRIFEPFYTKKVMGRSGTGLGLAVVWNTVEDHNGKILVTSSEKGTRFQLYFPASAEEKSGVQIKGDKPEELTGNNEHLLVVDDEPVLRDIASQMLLTLGYTVDSVSSGKLAIEFIRENTVDLILIDMLMEPGINGRETYEKILKISPNQKAIIVSGFSESDEVKAALALGAGGFIKKPYSRDQLGQIVKEVLHGLR